MRAVVAILPFAARGMDGDRRRWRMEEINPIYGVKPLHQLWRGFK
jgi:hypothetical protein